MNWSFALINNRLAEVFYEKKKNKIEVLGHCYIDASDYKTKKEQKWIEEDPKKLNLSYYKKRYKSKIPNLPIKITTGEFEAE